MFCHCLASSLKILKFKSMFSLKHVSLCFFAYLLHFREGCVLSWADISPLSASHVFLGMFHLIKNYLALLKISVQFSGVILI